ncbi:MAG: hypothetical protein MZV65_40430 [Chromatiales bacterium]|nr:hypothetical protein [Chromatiales bacterium]
MLTGYASIATAVEAIKLGAVHYLAKPADADEIVAAFLGARRAMPRSRSTAAAPERKRAWNGSTFRRCWREYDGNISATARAPRHAPPHLAAQAGKAAGRKL